jgi:hypothetical protein
MIFDSEIDHISSKKKIVIVKGTKEPKEKESPSIMIPDEIVNQYLRCEPSITFKKKCPLSFLAIPLPGSLQTRIRSDRFASSSRGQIRYLNREQSLKNKIPKPMKMFDYNEIVTVSHLNMRLR